MHPRAQSRQTHEHEKLTLDIPGENSVQHTMIWTADDLPGHRVARDLRVAHDITIRLRSLVGNFFGEIQ